MNSIVWEVLDTGLNVSEKTIPRIIVNYWPRLLSIDKLQRRFRFSLTCGFAIRSRTVYWKIVDHSNRYNLVSFQSLKSLISRDISLSFEQLLHISKNNQTWSISRRLLDTVSNFLFRLGNDRLFLRWISKTRVIVQLRCQTPFRFSSQQPIEEKSNGRVAKAQSICTISRDLLRSRWIETSRGSARFNAGEI